METKIREINREESGRIIVDETIYEEYKSLRDFNFGDLEDYAAVFVYKANMEGSMYSLSYFPVSHQTVPLYIVDVDMERELIRELKLAYCPMVAFLHKKEVVGRVFGNQETITYLGFINEHLKRAKRRDKVEYYEKYNDQKL